jgi:DNA-binding transcriptional LysR family regulator
VVRLGIPEDFAAYRLPEVLSDFARSRPTLRLDVRSGLSVNLQAALARGELDIVLYKRNTGEGDGSIGWPERLQWVTSRKHPVDMRRDPIPIAVAEQGCLYRNRLIHALEAAGRGWHIAYTSPNLAGIQAAASVGLGVAILPDVAIMPDHKIVDAKDFPPITNTEIAIMTAENASPATRRLADVLADFCDARAARKVA